MKAGKLLQRGLTLAGTLLSLISLFALTVFADGEESGSSGGLSTAALVWIIVGGVLLVVAVVLCIKFREKLAASLRVYKSEFKKVSWLSWDQTKKSTLVVLVVLIACAALICLVDLGLSKAFLAVINAIGG